MKIDLSNSLSFVRAMKQLQSCDLPAPGTKVDPKAAVKPAVNPSAKSDAAPKETPAIKSGVRWGDIPKILKIYEKAAKQKDAGNAPRYHALAALLRAGMSEDQAERLIALTDNKPDGAADGSLDVSVPEVPTLVPTSDPNPPASPSASDAAPVEDTWPDIDAEEDLDFST